MRPTRLELCGFTAFRDPVVVDFADALKLPRFALAGYDWGGRAVAITAALHPERVRSELWADP